jgi:SAM-dependent methyltransferase
MSDLTQPRDHENRAIDFGRSTEDYERYRPGFPDSFFDRLAAQGWITAGNRAADFGTGTGTVAFGLAARGLRVTGLDISPELLTAARRIGERLKLAVEFVEGRAEATGLEDSSVDIVSAGQCWWWFDSTAALEEARRILVPGGRLLICNFSYLPLRGNVASCTEELILKHNPGWTKAGWRGIHPEQVRALDEGGFQNVESFSYTVDVPFTHEAWRGRMRTCNGVGSALNGAQVDAFDKDLGDLLVEAFPGELSVPHRVFATCGVAG